MSELPNPLGIDVEAYIQSLPRGTLTDYEFTLIAGNIRTFYHYVNRVAPVAIQKEVTQYKEAYENMRAFAESHGLNTAVSNAEAKP